MTDVIKWSTMQISRRRLLRRAAVSTFALFSGLSVGVPEALAYPCCTGPYGTSNCGFMGCNGYVCHSNDAETTCSFIRGFCQPGSACWTTWICVRGTCCDCQCCDAAGCWYCFCYG